jgi:hypothetical protein
MTFLACREIFAESWQKRKNFPNENFFPAVKTSSAKIFIIGGIGV